MRPYGAGRPLRRPLICLVLAAAALVLLLPQAAAQEDYSDNGDGNHPSSASSSQRSHARAAARRSRLQQRRATQQHVQQLLKQCPLPGYCRRPAGLPTAEQYVAGEPQKLEMREQKHKVAEFIAGKGFQARLKQLKKLPDKRGILISAGKPHHVGTAAVILHALRNHLRCRLPVEVAFVGDSEVDPATRATLSAAFPPLHWLDLNSSAVRNTYPAHHRKDFKMDRYEPKIFALYHTRFQQVLLLDADNMPLLEPSYLFSSPHMTQHGNMLWMDLWSPLYSSTTFVGHSTVWPLLGLKKDPYWDVLAAGQGHVRRMAESGQLLLDRVAHADVLEYLWWLTSYSDTLYHHVLGDKDTLAFAFAAAGKLHEVAFVVVPPGAAFRHQAAGQSREPNDKNNVVPTWRFQGMTQYDHEGNAAFFHRTFAKWEDARELPPPLQVVSGPLPNSFIWSYLGNKTTGFTPDIPEHTLRPVRLNCPQPQSHFLRPLAAGPSGGRHKASSSTYAAAPALGIPHGGCPLELFFGYLALRDWGLPVAQQPELMKVCRQGLGLLQRLRAEAADAAGDGAGSDAHDAPAASGQDGSWEKQAAAARALLAAGLHVESGGDGHRHVQAAAADAGSASSSSSLWPQLHEFVWLRNCRLLQQQQDQGLPVNCSAASWHVARYMLQDAEQLATDSDGNLQADVDPRLPVILLNNVSPVGDQESVSSSDEGAGDGSSNGGSSVRDDDGNDPRAQQGTCGGVVGAWCSVDVLQRQVLPAAVAWVKANWEQLPLLKDAKEKKQNQQSQSQSQPNR